MICEFCGKELSKDKDGYFCNNIVCPNRYCDIEKGEGNTTTLISFSLIFGGFMDVFRREINTNGGEEQ